LLKHSRVLNITIANNVSDILRQTLKRKKKKKKKKEKTDSTTHETYVLIVIACVASIKYQIKTPFYLSSEWSLAWAEIVVEVVDVVLNRGID